MSGPGDALRYFAPSPALAPFVTVLFAWTGDGAAQAGWMPSIDAQIAIRLSGDARFICADGHAFRPAPAAVIGALSGTTYMATGPGFRSVGAGLTAAGWHHLIGMRASEANDTATDLAALWGDRATGQMLTALEDADGVGPTVRLLDECLTIRAAATAHRSDWRATAIDRWIAASPTLSIDALTAATGLSHRQTNRLTLDYLGFSPKLAMMKHRALRAATALSLGSYDTFASGPDGYVDQSHMIRDFRRFIGTTPGRLVRGGLARHVFEAPERAGASLAHVGLSNGA